MAALPFAFNFIDTGGVVASGAKLNIYTQSTTTRIPWYTDSGLSVPGTNPIIGDADGRISGVYFSSLVAYSIQATTSDGATVLMEADVVGGVLIITSAVGLIVHPTWLPGLSSTVNNSITTSVKWHGAAGDGSTDDTAAFQMALAAVGIGGSVRVPANGGGITYYIVDDIDISLASQSLICEPGAVLKMKANTSNHTLIDVAAADFTFTGEIDGNKASGNTNAGYISVQPTAARCTLNIPVARDVGYYVVHHRDAPGLTVRGGNFYTCTRTAVFSTLPAIAAGGTASGNVDGPDIDIEAIYWSDKTAGSDDGGVIVRGMEVAVDPLGYRFLNTRVRIGKIVMPENVTLTSMVGVEVKGATGVFVEIGSCYGGSIAWSFAEVTNYTVVANGRGYAWYGGEVGGLCVDGKASGSLRGATNGGTVYARHAIACQGNAGANVGFAWDGVCSGAISQAGATGRLINVANLDRFSFNGDFSCGASEHVFRFTDNGKGTCHGNYYGDTGGQRVAIFAESQGHVTITGHAFQFDLAGAHITSNATAVNNIKLDLEYEDCNGGGITSVITGSGSPGENIKSLGTGQFISAGNVRGQILNYSRNLIDCELTGSPEGVVTAGVGSIARRVDGADGTILYVKSTGTGNTGWDALPYYEEGTFTPSITFVTPGNLALTSVTAAGKYTRRGNRVAIEFAWTGTPTFTTAAGGLRLTGLPFTAGAAQIAAFKLVNISSAFAWPAARTMVQPYALSSTTTMALGALGTGAALADFTTANLTSAAAHTIEFSGEYRV